MVHTALRKPQSFSMLSPHFWVTLHTIFSLSAHSLYTLRTVSAHSLHTILDTRISDLLPSVLPYRHFQEFCLCFYHGPDVSQDMVMWPPCCHVSHHLTNRQDQTCLQGLQLEQSSKLSHDCLMTQNDIFWILLAMGQCRVGPCFFFSKAYGF